MIEHAPTNTKSETYESKEGIDGAWRVEKAAAPAQVDALIQSIDGFDAMSRSEQVVALKSELTTIANRADNSERFVFWVLGNKTREIELYEEVASVQSQLETLGRNVDTKA